MTDLSGPFEGTGTQPLSQRLIAAAGCPAPASRIAVGELTERFGDRSFGWCIMLFSLVNLLPLPTGFTLLTALPLILVTAQMALGLEQVYLPRLIAARTLDRGAYRRSVLRLRPLLHPLDNLLRPRLPAMFLPAAEQVLGALLLLVSLALFLPVPLVTWLTAIALLLTGAGLVERDGLLCLTGAILGAAAVTLTIFLGLILVLAAGALPG